MKLSFRKISIGPAGKRRIKRIVNWALNIYLTAFVLLVVWVLCQIFVFSSFSTPTQSMTPNIIPGDYVLVNKFVMGGRLFNIFDALDGKQVNISRGPHFGELKRGDVVVFNHPYAGSWDSLAMNIRLYYMKRCMAVAGDTVEIRDCRYRINGSLSDDGAVERQVFLRDFLDSNDSATVARAVVIKAFPNDSAVKWTVREFGPLIVPKKGMSLPLDTLSAIVYRNYIEWESGERLTNDSTGIRLGGRPLDSYVFTEDYCFVGGDNAFNSQDSRYFGLLPMPYVVGKAAFIWQSVDKESGRRRWDRTLKGL